MKQDKERPSISEQAWGEFISRLDEAGRNIMSETGAVDARERAEGYRNLTRLIAIGLDLYLENADSERPVFTPMLTPTQKFGGDNPDTTYDYATIDEHREYRLTGNRGGSPYLGMCVYGKTRGEDGDMYPFIGAKLSDIDMVFEANGDFEVILSKQRPDDAKNWLELKAGTDSMIVRQYYTGDRSHPAVYEIETLQPAPDLPPYSEELLAKHLQAVGNFVKDTSETSAALSVFAALNTVESDDAGKAKAHSALQLVDGEVQAKSGDAGGQDLAAKIDPKIVFRQLPAPDIQYSGAWWKLKPGEVLVVEGAPTPARYWSVQTFNRWMESGEYRYQQVYINSADAELNEDGSFQVVLAAENPGVKNWIDTCGYSQGQVCFRALLAENPIDVKYRIARFSEFE
jgi:hypothetical protein